MLLISHANNRMCLLQDKRRLLKQIDSLELQLQIKTDEVTELKGKLDAESKGRLEDHHEHDQVSESVQLCFV